MTEISFFTRLLEPVSPGERYRFALEQIRAAERLGYARAWVAQHHFHEGEGGLPSPFVLLAHAAAQTTTIRLGTAVVTLTLEDPVRVAEDAVVADLLSGGRVDLGIGSGSTPDSFVPFGLDARDKAAEYEVRLRKLDAALRGADVGAGNTIYPAAGTLRDRVWQATFSAGGGARAGRFGHGLLLSRVQARPAGNRDGALHDTQLPIIRAYREALPEGVAGHVTASRTVYVTDDREAARRFADAGIRYLSKEIGIAADTPLEDFVRLTDTHLGTPEDVIESLSRDLVLAEADEIAIQVHSVNPGHELTLRSMELFAREVAPHFGWGESVPAPSGEPSPARAAEEARA